VWPIGLPFDGMPSVDQRTVSCGTPSTTFPGASAGPGQGAADTTATRSVPTRRVEAREDDAPGSKRRVLADGEPVGVDRRRVERSDGV
jgi:hypothetical protein